MILVIEKSQKYKQDSVLLNKFQPNKVWGILGWFVQLFKAVLYNTFDISYPKLILWIRNIKSIG